MAAMKRKAPASVAAYIAAAPPSHRAALRALRRDIRAAAPGAEEVISYQMPGYRQGRMLVYFAAFRDHCTFFFLSRQAQRRYARELAQYELIPSGAGIKFDVAKPLPTALVRKLVKLRVAEAEAEAKAKTKAKARAMARRKAPSRGKPRPKAKWRR